MKVVMLEDVIGKDFSFKKAEVYRAIDGDSITSTSKELKNNILVRQPNSPKKKDWWCLFSKDFLGVKYAIVE